MSRITRVLLADDAATVRRLLSQTLNACGDMEVVGAAVNGQEALDLIPETRPDVIVLDVEMPVMDGIDALRQIRKKDRDIPVLMFSSLTVAGAEATLDALSLGANDYIAKPTSAASISQAVAYLKAELETKIRHWANLRSAKQERASSAPTTQAPFATIAEGSADVVAIASSTGGPNALTTIVSGLPQSLRVPMLVVQHMPPLFTSLLAKRLDDASSFRVTEAKDGQRVIPGEMLIAPGDQHMTVQKIGGQRRISLNQGPPENSCRPAADVLFRSVAETYRSRSLAIVLTGMGKDGYAGAEAIKKQGGVVLAQDQASSVVWGMPRVVADAGLADGVVPLRKIPSQISQYTSSPASAEPLRGGSNAHSALTLD